MSDRGNETSGSLPAVAAQGGKLTLAGQPPHATLDSVQAALAATAKDERVIVALAQEQGVTPAVAADMVAATMQRAAAATARWIGTYTSAATKTAYTKGVGWWLAYCASKGINPLMADETFADGYLEDLRAVRKGNGAPLADSTLNQRLTAASAWYKYLARAKVVPYNPFPGMRRPKVSDESTTTGIGQLDMGRLLSYAKEHETARTYALLFFLAGTASRITAALKVKRSDFHQHDDEPHVWLTVKGGKRKRFPVSKPVQRAMKAYWEGQGIRRDGYLFATASGNPMDQAAAFRTIRRVAKAAGLEAWDQISPHSFRHAYATVALTLNKSLADVQDALGHASPVTTKRYDRAAGAYDRSPSGDVMKAYESAASTL